jgi:transcriptional regulator with XRE-family HTH domain
MTDDQAGRLLAAVRTRLGLRQVDVGQLAGVDQKTVSLLERGQLERVSLERFRRVCIALQVEARLELRWRGGEGDRLIDRDHARTVEAVVSELTSLGWETYPEFTFNVWGERGSVDVVAWNPTSRALLLIEVKTRLTDLQGMLMALSRKVRLVPALVEDERGWQRRSLGHVLVILDSHANRNMVARHRATFAATFPTRTAAARKWLREPSGDLAGLWFVALRRETPADHAASRRVRPAHAQPSARVLPRQASGS